MPEFTSKTKKTRAMGALEIIQLERKSSAQPKASTYGNYFHSPKSNLAYRYHKMACICLIRKDEMHQELYVQQTKWGEVN
jgi:hypothetical protein